MDRLRSCLLPRQCNHVHDILDWPSIWLFECTGFILLSTGLVGQSGYVALLSMAYAASMDRDGGHLYPPSRLARDLDQWHRALGRVVRTRNPERRSMGNRAADLALRNVVRHPLSPGLAAPRQIAARHASEKTAQPVDACVTPSAICKIRTFRDSITVLVIVEDGCMLLADPTGFQTKSRSLANFAKHSDLLRFSPLSRSTTTPVYHVAWAGGRMRRNRRSGGSASARRMLMLSFLNPL